MGQVIGRHTLTGILYLDSEKYQAQKCCISAWIQPSLLGKHISAFFFFNTLISQTWVHLTFYILKFVDVALDILLLDACTRLQDLYLCELTK